VVSLAYVPPHRLRVVALQHRAAELARLHAYEFQPELLRCFGICVLVDVHPEYQVVPCDSGDIQESEEERAPSAARLRISSWLSLGGTGRSRTHRETELLDTARCFAISS